MMKTILLPKPIFDGKLSLESVLHKRRSGRTYRAGSLTLTEVGQLLWAAQGITSVNGYRTAPSAGALYPLELYLVTGKMEELSEGVYRYDNHKHTLQLVVEGDKGAALARAALGQECVADGSAVLVLAAVYKRTTRKYGKRGIQYVHMEVGHVSQNLFLQATALDIATVVVGAFHDDEVQRLLQLPKEVVPLSLMPLGRKPA